MELVLMNGFDLYKAMMVGAKRLIMDRHELNKINVFPVPDGDTGSNMAFLMQTIINEAKPDSSVSGTMESIANASLSGSRGNSGLIFSEFLYGVYEQFQGKVTASIQDFILAFRHAAQKAYKAIMNPVEGTILTVFRKVSEVGHAFTSFKDFFETILHTAKKAVAETADELPILKSSGVVDAGAKGFSDFLEGMHHYFVTGEFDFTEPIEIESEVEDIHLDDCEERYCTEALIMNVTKSAEEIKQIFSTSGSSLIVSSRSDKMRIHIHTNHPDEFFYTLSQYSDIMEQKVDDMVRQMDAIRKPHPSVAIVTDSIADLPQDLIDHYQIHQMPLGLLVDGSPYLDKVTISANTFYKLLKDASSFSSSQPSQKQIERHLDFLLEHYEDIIFITVSSQMSGTYNAIVQYAKDHPQVKVFDSKLNSGAEGLVVLQAAQWVEEQKSASEIMDMLTDYAKKTKIYVSVKTLKYMVKQGRVSKLVGLAAKLTNLKPVVGIDANGKGEITRKAMSLSGNIRQIIDLMKQENVSHYAIVHAQAESRVHDLTEKLKKLTGKDPLYTMSISPIVAMNAGLGAVAVAVTFEKEVSE